MKTHLTSEKRFGHSHIDKQSVFWASDFSEKKSVFWQILWNFMVLFFEYRLKVSTSITIFFIIELFKALLGSMNFFLCAPANQAKN